MCLIFALVANEEKLFLSQMQVLGEFDWVSMTLQEQTNIVRPLILPKASPAVAKNLMIKRTILELRVVFQYVPLCSLM